MQFQAEGSSVPDHIKLYQEKYPNVTVKGIFCAPLIHDRVHAVINSILIQEKIPLISIADEELLDVLNSNTKEELIEKLESKFL